MNRAIHRVNGAIHNSKISGGTNNENNLEKTILNLFSWMSDSDIKRTLAATRRNLDVMSNRVVFD